MDPKALFNIGYKAEVKQYPYRRAVVQDAQIVLDRRQDVVREFEENLARTAGVEIDNHTCYSITTYNAPTLYVMCSDFKMSIGTKIKEGSW